MTLSHNQNSCPFDLLNLPMAFDIDENVLEQHFETAMSAVHPDRHSGLLSKQQAAYHAANINKAYQSLRCVRTRARLVLQSWPQAWPPVLDATIHELLDNEGLEQKKDLLLAQACHDFNLACQKKDVGAAHHAYWRIQCFGLPN